MKITGISLLMLAVLSFPHVSCAESLPGDVRAALTDKDWQVRLSAIERLANRRDEETVRSLIRTVESRDEYWKVQIKAIQLLGDTGDPRAIDLLTYILNSNTSDWKCPAIQSYAAAALGNFGNHRHVIDALVKGIRSDEVLIREACIRALGKIGSAETVSHLIPVLEDSDSAVRLGAVQALQQIGDQEAIPHLKSVYENDRNDAVRRAAGRALASFGN